MTDLCEDLQGLELAEQIFTDVKFYVSGQVSEKAVELLKSGGAERMNYFSDYVTHLICGQDCEETDLSDATEIYEIPALVEKWIFLCARLKCLVNTKPFIYNPNKLFSGLVFCFSRIGKDRDGLWAVITYHGGAVQLNLTRAATHLITAQTESDKYRRAVSFPDKIEVVSPDWVFESVRNKALAQASLFHPKLIDYPVVVKRPDTTAITGFEPECGEKEEEATSAADSTQALLDKLKQRMPWNQPAEPPPNVVAPSFTGQKSVQEQRIFSPTSQASQFNPVLGSPNQVPRSVVHHTPQPNQQSQQQQPQQQQFIPGNFPNNNPNFNKILEQLQRPNVQTINRIGQHNFLQKPNQQMINMQTQQGIVQRQIIKQLPGGQQIIQQQQQNPTQNPQHQQQQLVNRQIIGNQQMLQGQQKMQQIGQRILVGHQGQQQNIALQKQQLLQSQQQLGLEQQIVSSVQQQNPSQNIIHQSGGMTQGVNQGQIVQQHLNQTPVQQQQQQIVQNQLINQQQPQQMLQNQQQQIVQNQQQQQQIAQSPQHQQQQIIQNQQPQQMLQNQQQIIQNQPQQIVQNQQSLQSQQQQQLQNQMITQQNQNIIQSPQHQQLQSPQRQQLQSPQHHNQQLLQQQSMLNQSQTLLNQQNQNVLINQQQLHNQLINTSSQQTNVINHQHITSQQNLLNALQQQQQQSQQQQHLTSQNQLQQQQSIVQVQQQNVVIHQQQNVVIQQQNLVQQQNIISQQQQPNILQQQPNILQQQQQQQGIVQQQNIVQQQGIVQQNIVQQQGIVQQQNIHQQAIITQQQQQNLLNQQNQNLINQQGSISTSQQNILNINQQQLVTGANQNQGFNNVNIPPNKVIQNQFGQQVIVQNQPQILSSNQQNSQQQQQFVNTPANQNYQQQQSQFIQNQNQYNNQQQQQQQQQPGQQMPQLVQAGQIQQNQFVQQNQTQQQQGGNLQIINQQQILNQQQLQKQPQHLMGNQPNQQFQPGQNPQQRPALWQQIRHPNGVNIVQQQGARVQWSGGGAQTQPPVQRQFIHLDAQTHQQLQQMAPEERALFVQKLQKHRLILQRQQILQQQRSGHILIRSNGPVPQGLTPQQHMQWLQQQAKQQGIVLQQNIQPPPAPTPQPQPPPPTPTPTPAPIQTIQQHTPGLSPIQQPQPPQTPFSEQNLQQQRQQLRLHQLQLQREQAQKGVQGLPQAPGQIPVRPQGIDPTSAVIDNQQSPLVNAKTKTALANMLSIRLQSGNTAMGPGGETLSAEPSAAGTLRMMTQRNAALNSNNNRPDILTLQQQSRVINPPNTDVIRPPAPAQVQQNPPPDLPKPQYSPRSVLPIQHRPGTFYGHNPNLKLPPDLFLLGCIFVVVELERFLDESMPGWQKRIEKYGGEIEKQYCSRVTHVLCETQRHGVVMQALRDCKRCVTLYWLSDVMNRKQVLPPWTALHLPTMYLDTVPASKHLISLTGFSGTERERVKHMIKYIGASLTTYFSKHNTLLIATKPEGPKYNHAKRWGVPAVNIQWLTEVMLGNFSALNQLENVKYQQFNTPVNFCFDPALVPNLMHAWKMPINISQESYKRVKRSASPGAMPQKVKKMKVEHVTDENENVENLPKSSTHRILFSRCTDMKELKEMVIQLGGSVVKHPSEATHLVLSQLLRTTKLLHSVCLGTKIISEYWVRDSSTSKTFLDENNYTLDTKEFNSKYKCDFAQTLMLKNRSKLLEGKFFFITPSVFPSKKTLTEIIQACGGVVERTRRTISQIEATNINSPYSYVILTHEKDLHLVADLLKNKKDKIRIVCNVELILSAVLRQTFDVEPYVVKVV